MTNEVVGIIVTAIVTNWTNPFIPEDQWPVIQQRKGVPEKRVRVGIVERQQRNKFVYEGKTFEQVVSREHLHEVIQVGKAQESVQWLQTQKVPTKAVAPKGGAPKVEKPAVEPPKKKKRWWHRKSK